jgi:cysteinyl-tRNA synthetase
MALQLYNSLTKRKELFTPITPGKIKLYVCGVTVYDYCHIGHARTYLAFDVIIRYLRSRGFEVTYVRNITDIDDKIIKRAHENHETTEQLVARFVKVMHDEFAKLNILPPDLEPTATGTIAEIIAMNQTLIEKGFAYAANNGDVYYRTAKFKDYGKLSGQLLDQLRVGERVEINTDKEDPLDFVLWKSSKPGEPSWESPWGPGRPGWHIECSAMTKKSLGDTFDIHAGGSDLRFPHHENEIAQSEAANGCQFARYWLHSGMVQVNAEKMSKSLGNFFIIGDVLKQYPAEVVRYFLISAHYRSEVNYSDENLQNAKASLERFYTALRGLDLTQAKLPEGETYTERFIAAMDDDFNTPAAMAILFELIREINRLRETDLKQAAQYGLLLKKLCEILGISQQNPEDFFKGGQDISKALLIRNKFIERLINARNVARKNKDWAKSDLIRDQLQGMGITLEDAVQQTTWCRIKNLTDLVIDELVGQYELAIKDHAILKKEQLQQGLDEWKVILEEIPEGILWRRPRPKNVNQLNSEDTGNPGFWEKYRV